MNRATVKLSSINQFEQVIEENKYVLVLKYSETYPVSANAHDQFNKFLYERDMGGYYLIVQQGHDLSDYIAKKANARYESLRAFYFVNGETVWNRDYDDVSVSSLAQAEEQ